MEGEEGGNVSPLAGRFLSLVLAPGDNSVADVVCKETGRQVAHVAGKISAIDENSLTQIIGILPKMYPNHCCVIERNNHGHAVIGYCRDNPDINLYRQEAIDDITGKMSTKYGWDTNNKSKGFAISELKKHLEDGTCIPQHFETYGELRTFVYGERWQLFREVKTTGSCPLPWRIWLRKNAGSLGEILFG